MDVGDGILEIARELLDRAELSGPDNVEALCPFHANHNTPSFRMSIRTGLFICHSCGVRGNLGKFVRDRGVSEAVVRVRWGVLIEWAEAEAARWRATAEVVDPRRPVGQSNEPLPESLLGLFDYVPDELVRAGFWEETLGYFDVGVDRDRNRITYPLRDHLGRLVGISGRARSFLPVEHKYHVYGNREWDEFVVPRRAPLVRSEILWNYDRVFPRLYPAAKRGRVVVVEGFKAAMWLSQAGVEDVIALLGNSVSRVQKYLLERLGAEVVLWLDDNEAGQRGTEFFLRTVPTLPIRVVRHDIARGQPDGAPLSEVLETIERALPSSTWVDPTRKK